MIKRQRIEINGIVQGVGFRPFVFNLARRLKISGFVRNTSQGVYIEAQGSEDTLQRFIHSLLKEKPPLAEIISLRQTEISPNGDRDFRIVSSTDSSLAETLIAPDMAICDDCLRELRDPSDRRYRYPFINCTNCGPRFTIIRKIPYDRPNTSMAPFTMCPQCQAEFENPADRRFHAQPNACPQCGPYVWLEEPDREKILAVKNEALQKTIRALLQGRIVAIKGLGGFHLTVDATNEQAVQRLRLRKNREEKPLAIMVPNVKSVRRLCILSEKEQTLLTSAQRPIILLKQKESNPIAKAVAPGNRRLGIMLPYTPLHYILFDLLQEYLPEKGFPALVMTSANRSEEPIVISNQEARSRLADIADFLLLHNRDILVRTDDSVVAQFKDQTVFFRRSRGYVPKPVFLPESGPEILAVGGELKNTICLTKGNQAFLSQHIGDLENLRAFKFFEETIKHLQNILRIRPRAVVCDLHPQYFSTQWAKAQNHLPIIQVQHHHAHLAAVLAEWQWNDPVIGLILDGTGYGYDGTIWGGEILIGDFTEIRRVAYFEPMPLPGGEVAIKQPWRTGLAYLYRTFGKNLPALPFLQAKPVQTILTMIDNKLNCPLTSSCGRLFDAAAVISGGRETIHYEAQAAIELMQAVGDQFLPPPYQVPAAVPQIPLRPIIRALTEEALKGTSFDRLAGRFHQTLIHLFAETVQHISKISGIKTVALSGGVFQNEILLLGLLQALQRRGFRVLTHRRVPPNDGGISLGQAAIGQRLLKQGQAEVHFAEE